MSRRSSVSAVRAVSCPAECDQFRLASCKAPRPSSAPLPLRVHARKRERERMRRRTREREREKSVLSRESSFFSSSRPSFLPPFLSFSSFLSFLYQETPSWSPSSLMQLSLFLSFLDLFLLRSPQCYRSRVSPRFAHFPPLPPDEGASSFSVVLVFRVVLFLFFRPLILLRVALFPSEFTPEREYFSSSTAASIYRAPFSLFLVLFCPCRSRCSALFEFKRGSHRCLVSPS